MPEAQSRLRAPGAVVAGLGLGLVVVSAPAIAQDDDRAYVVDPYGQPVMSAYGECWRSPYPTHTDQTDIARECGDEQDADGDGVVDARDDCPDTPAGAEVDARGCELDSDGDGVVDSRDACAGTPAGAEVDARGCELDSDGDGVVDSRDACAGTPAGSEVDARGCAIDTTIETTIDGDAFAVDSAELPADLRAQLDRLVDRLNATRGQEQLNIVGHTDSTGAADYNRRLSERRANAVADYLGSRGIDRSVMTAEGRGESDPVASNATAQGRAENRRVVISVE